MPDAQVIAPQIDGKQIDLPGTKVPRVSGRSPSAKPAQRASRRFAQFGLAAVLLMLISCFVSMLFYSGGFSRLSDPIPAAIGR